MKSSTAQNEAFAPTTVAVATLALVGFVWAGCDSKSGSKEKASAEKPSAGSQQKPDKEKGSPSPSAGQKQQQKKPAPGALKKRKPKGGEVTDEEIDKFVEVAETLRPKKQEFKKAMQGAESKKEAMQAQKRIMKATRKAAKDAGLEFSRFRAISRQVKSNPKLQKRLKEASGKPSPSSEADAE